MGFMRILLLLLLLFPASAFADEDLRVVTPSAENILKQIDPEIGEEFDKRIEALKAPIKPAEPTAPVIPEIPDGKVLYSDIADFKFILEFSEGASALTETQKQALLQKILPRAQAFENTRIQLLSFGSRENTNKSRRIALTRGIEIRDFFGAHNISYRRFDILPRYGETNANRVEIMLLPL